MAQFASVYDVDLVDARVDMRATFDSADKYGLANNGTAFQQATFKLEVDSPSPIKQVRQLVAHAEMGCHAAQSLRSPVQVDFEVRINGENFKLSQE